jgi:hypothetical protein
MLERQRHLAAPGAFILPIGQHNRFLMKAPFGYGVFAGLAQ